MKVVRIVTIVAFTLTVSALFGLTSDEAVERLRARMNRLPRLTGVISWTSIDGQTYSGSFKYLPPGKIYVKFTSPIEKILVSNGTSLWIYTPGTNMCGVQELAKGTSSGGIVGMVSGYNGIVSESDAGYIIKLKNDERLYREIILSVDRSFLIKGAIFKRNDGRIMSFSISDASTGVAVNPSLFEFKVPKGVQVVRNPMNIR